MKTQRLFFALCFFLFMLCCCVPFENPHPNPALVETDSLMWQQPDSALTRLIPWFDSEPETEYDRHYAQLLLAELLYKNDFEQTNREDLLKAVDYFDSLVDASKASPSNVFLDARAHYINGVGYYEKDSVVEACREYLKALEILECHPRYLEKQGCQLPRFLALTCTHLTDLFSHLYLHEQALYFGKRALDYYQKYEVTPSYLAWILDEIGMHYDMMDNQDSALYYYQRGVETIVDTNELIYRDIRTHQILLNHKLYRQLDTTIIQLHGVISKAQDTREVIARYIVLGEIFYNEKQLDSAWYYLQKVFQESARVGSKKQAAEWLFEICKAQNKFDESTEYVNFLIPFANQEENKSEIKSQITEFYKSYHHKKQARSFKLKIKENLKWASLFFVCLLAIISSITILYHKNKRKRKQLEVQIIEGRRSYETQQKSLSGRLRKSNENLKDALQIIERLEAEKGTTGQDILLLSDGKDRYEKFRQTPICQEILNTVATLHATKTMVLKTDLKVKEYKSFALSNYQANCLLKVFETYYPEMVSHCKQKKANLTRKDWLYLSLSFLQIDKMCVCILLQDTYYTWRRHTMKLEQIFNCTQGLTAFLMGQVNAL